MATITSNGAVVFIMSLSDLMELATELREA
jgi:hypothetical protein